VNALPFRYGSSSDDTNLTRISLVDSFPVLILLRYTTPVIQHDSVTQKVDALTRLNQFLGSQRNPRHITEDDAGWQVHRTGGASGSSIGAFTVEVV